MKYTFKVTFRPHGNLVSGDRATIAASSDVTLYDLHESMLYAFGLTPGRAHGFFMDNCAFSLKDAYYDPMVELMKEGQEGYPQYRHTPDYLLGDSRLIQNSRPLVAGDKFRYAYNFATDDVWMFEVISVENVPFEGIEILDTRG